jgi:hypothetical protein
MRIGSTLAALVTCFLLGFGAVSFAGAVPQPTPDPFDPTATDPNRKPGKPPPSTSTSTTATQETTPTNPPLTVTPYLGSFDYVFPVVGSVSYGDSYGGERSDVPSKWHHGDDIFAPLGAPVVAVADGGLTRVGWEKIGGWRLWVTDAAGNTFYYAHLSAYTPLALRATHVKAGQVLGFIGDTGDAITTPFHLHFEVHPASLRYLGYDGAVNPTGYLGRWRHLGHVRLPRPVHPPLPAGVAGEQAERAFRQLATVPSLNRKPARRATARPSHQGPRLQRLSAPARLQGPSVAVPPSTAPVAAGPDRPVRLAGPASAPARKTAAISSLEIAGFAAVAAIVTLAALLLLRRSGWRSLRRVFASTR